jgi:hypothetical protein
MTGEMFGGYTEVRNAMGPEPGLDAKNSPAKTTRSHTEIVKGTETVGVCTGAFTRALNPLDTADFVRDVLLNFGLIP